MRPPSHEAEAKGMDHARRNASGLRPNPYPAACGGTRLRGGLENGRSPEASLEWLGQAAVLLTELQVEVVIADDFMPTEPAWRIECGNV